jgi:hypothetical protein
VGATIVIALLQALSAYFNAFDTSLECGADVDFSTSND